MNYWFLLIWCSIGFIELLGVMYIMFAHYVPRKRFWYYVWGILTVLLGPLFIPTCFISACIYEWYAKYHLFEGE